MKEEDRNFTRKREMGKKDRNNCVRIMTRDDGPDFL